MKKYLQPKHLPIPVGLTILVLGLVAGIFAINRVQNLFTKASPENTPLQVKITNITHSSFVISWITAGESLGSVTIGETREVGEIKGDIRETNQENHSKSKVHFVMTDNLKPQTKYYFKIISGGKTYDNSGKPYEITTANTSVPEDNDIAQGRVLDTSGSPLPDVLVYLSMANTIEQAAVTDKNGHWMIPLATSKTLTLQGLSNYDRTAQIIEITAKTGTETATATLTTANDNPVPDITIGKNHNFLDEGSIPQGSVPDKTTISQSGFQAPTSVPFTQSENLTILFPSEDEEVNSVIPEFIGNGPKGKELIIEIESDQKISSTTTVSDQGDWKWSPQTPLTPGEHRITISYVDNGIVKKISRSFTVLATGESDLPSFTATPSGEIKSPTITPYASPASSLSPTSLPTIRPSVSATMGVEVSSSPTQAEQLLDSGIDSFSRIFLGAGILIILVGLALVFF
ncbi:fibronectin type III domain-containing protein [Patescibacteria group bacterium]|nr:fibronectin type III domain-containing protein [Patescibacteria group bacterium]